MKFLSALLVIGMVSGTAFAQPLPPSYTSETKLTVGSGDPTGDTSSIEMYGAAARTLFLQWTDFSRPTIDSVYPDGTKSSIIRSASGECEMIIAADLPKGTASYQCHLSVFNK